MKGPSGSESDTSADATLKPDRYRKKDRIYKGFRAPATRSLGWILIFVGVMYLFAPGGRWKSPLIMILGILILTFARHVRHFMVPDCWYIHDDK